MANDAVDAAVEHMQPAGGNARSQLVRRHTQPGELGQGDDTVMARGKRGDRPVEPTRSSFRGHIPEKD